MSDFDAAAAGTRRGRGNRAGLTAARIAEAARGLDAEAVTVKAVADKLGVDRAAIHHHVADLDGLRELVARDAFSVQLAPVTIPPGAGWRDACRLLAHSMHDAVLAAQGLGAYVRLSGANVVLLEPVEAALRIMLAAGFDEETAARGIAALASLAGAAAREEILSRRSGGHSQVPELLQALNTERDADLTVLRRVVDALLPDFTATQLKASIELVLDGIASRLHTPDAGPRA